MGSLLIPFCMDFSYVPGSDHTVITPQPQATHPTMIALADLLLAETDLLYGDPLHLCT